MAAGYNKRGKRMNTNGRKITKIGDELIYFFLKIGSDDIRMQLKKLETQFVMTIDANYDKEYRDKVRGLQRVLEVQTHPDAGVEETYWELMGMHGSLQDGELQLIGMMLDGVTVDIGEDFVHLVLEKNLA